MDSLEAEDKDIVRDPSGARQEQTYIRQVKPFGYLRGTKHGQEAKNTKVRINFSDNNANCVRKDVNKNFQLLTSPH